MLLTAAVLLFFSVQNVFRKYFPNCYELTIVLIPDITNWSWDEIVPAAVSIGAFPTAPVESVPTEQLQ